MPREQFPVNIVAPDFVGWLKMVVVRIRGPWLADDAVQEMVVQALDPQKNGPALTAENSREALTKTLQKLWLLRRSEQREQQRRSRSLERSEDAAPEILLRREAQAALAACVEALPAHLHQAVRARYFQADEVTTCAVVARQLGTSTTTAHQRLAKAMSALRDCLRAKEQA